MFYLYIYSTDGISLFIGRKRSVRFVKSEQFASDVNNETYCFKFFTFQLNDWSYNWIIIGRFLNGIGCGVSMTVSPVYLMENAPENLKGAFGCSFSIL